MQDKNEIKIYLKLNVLAFLLILSLSYSAVFVQKVNADFESLLGHEVYDFACKVINEKFYFQPKINLPSLEDRFENKINNLSDAHKYINKLINELDDPYTRLLSKEEFKDEQDIIGSKLIGIGIKLLNNKPVVLEVLPGSPANQEDIKQNDYILTVNNKNTRNLSSSEIASLLRGPKDTTLTVKIKRGKENLTKTLVRKELHFTAISSQLLDNNIAYIKVDTFIPETTSNDFKNELVKFMSAKGLIVDLRNNSGGLLKNAVEIADMFLSEGKIVSTENKFGKINELANSSTVFDKNVVLLVNEKTASASEILTSALKDNGRAIVIGNRTYGKGLVQEIVKLPDDSALHVTIAEYFTPSGKNINKTGLLPDIVAYNENEQIKKAKEILLGI